MPGQSFFNEVIYPLPLLEGERGFKKITHMDVGDVLAWSPQNPEAKNAYWPAEFSYKNKKLKIQVLPYVEKDLEFEIKIQSGGKETLAKVSSNQKFEIEIPQTPTRIEIRRPGGSFLSLPLATL